MQKFNIVRSCFWTSHDVCEYTKDARLLALYLVTGPQGNQIGYYVLPLGYAAADTGMTTEEARAAMQCLEDHGFCTYDRERQVVLILKYLHHNPLDSSKQVTGALRVVRDFLPDSPLLWKLVAAARDAGQDTSVSLADQLEEEYGEPTGTVPDGFPEGTDRVPDTLSDTLSDRDPILAGGRAPVCDQPSSVNSQTPPTPQGESEGFRMEPPPEKKRTRKRPADYGADFADWLEPWPSTRHGSIAVASDLYTWWRAQGYSTQRLIAARDAYANECEQAGREPQYVKCADTFLSKRSKFVTQYAPKEPA